MEWHLEWQWSNIRSVGRVRWSHGLSYYRSMLEYKWAGRHTRLTVTDGNRYPDASYWGDNHEQSKQQQERQWSDSRIGVRWSHGISYNHSMLEYNVNKFPPWLVSIMWNTAMSRKTHAPDSHWWKPLLWFCLLRRRSSTATATATTTTRAKATDTANSTAEVWQKYFGSVFVIDTIK